MKSEIRPATSEATPNSSCSKQYPQTVSSIHTCTCGSSVHLISKLLAAFVVTTEFVESAAPAELWGRPVQVYMYRRSGKFHVSNFRVKKFCVKKFLWSGPFTNICHHENKFLTTQLATWRSTEKLSVFMTTTSITRSGKADGKSLASCRCEHVASETSRLASAITWDGREEDRDPLEFGSPFLGCRYLSKAMLETGVQCSSCACRRCACARSAC